LYQGIISHSENIRKLSKNILKLIKRLGNVQEGGLVSEEGDVPEGEGKLEAEDVYVEGDELHRKVAYGCHVLPKFSSTGRNSNASELFSFTPRTLNRSPLLSFIRFIS
jgi:hypothetical protein